MIIRNTSRYPDDEVRDLVQFATEEMDTSRVCVNVKNCSSAFAGRAYQTVPRMSNAPRSCQCLVVLRIGAPEQFPRSNEVIRYKWLRALPGEPYDVRTVRSYGRSQGGVLVSHLERYVEVRQPYGGKKSPVYVCANWQEGLIAIAAHEMKHIQQFKNKLACRESSCERAAFERLKAWRALCAVRGVAAD